MGDVDADESIMRVMVHVVSLEMGSVEESLDLDGSEKEEKVDEEEAAEDVRFIKVQIVDSPLRLLCRISKTPVFSSCLL